MEKLIYVIRERESASGEAVRTDSLERIVPALHDEGATGVGVHLVDDRVSIAGPKPCEKGELPLRRVISCWVDAHDRRGPIDSVFDGVGERVDGYLVTESLWSDFGDERGAPRDWAAGERSPGVTTVALVHRNPGLDARTFREFWYQHQSPMSGRQQPRMRYVRNTVVHPVTVGAPPLDGVVVESWDSEAIVDDIVAFHDGDLENLTVMLDSVGTVFDLEALRSIAMSEYLC